MKTLLDYITADEARELIASGANVNAKNKWGFCPLHIAAARGKACIVRLLLEAGAKTDAEDDYEETALHKAVMNNRYGATWLLLKSGANVNNTDHKGNTPMHYAALVNNSELVEPLLEFGADPYAKNNEGKTPLDFCRDEYIASLLKQAMNKHEQDNNTIKTKTAQVIPMQKEQKEYKKVMSSAFHELRRSTTARKLRLLESILEAIYHLPSESDEAKPLLDVARGAIEELNGGKPVTREDAREIVVGYEDEDCIVPTVYNKDYPYHVYANEREMMNLITRKQHDLFRDHPDVLAELFEADKMVTYIN